MTQSSFGEVKDSSISTNSHVVGLIPAAGRGSRLGKLPFSKELLPLEGPADLDHPPGADQRTAIDHSMECLMAAGIGRACVVLSSEKEDLRRHLHERWMGHLAVDIKTLDDSPNVPASLNVAFPTVKDADSLLLFPDIVFWPTEAVKAIVDHRLKRGTDIVLALIPASSGEKIDIVTTGERSEIRAVTPKPGTTISGWTWVAAVWGPQFAAHMHNESSSIAASVLAEHHREAYVADILNHAINAGLSAETVSFPDGRSFDLGTLEELNSYWASGHR